MRPSVAEPPGFTLVEEDDVAFTLRLCREVNRIYADYQDGRLSSGDPLLAGLQVTVEMLAALSRTVHDGMPAMRITVAAAQAREMLAVLFDRDPMHEPPDRSFRRRYRSIMEEAARGLGGPVASIGMAAAGDDAPQVGPAPDPVTARDPATAGEPADSGRRPSGLRRIFGRRRR